MITADQQIGGKLHERTDAAVIAHTEQRNEPKARIAQQGREIVPAERLAVVGWPGEVLSPAYVEMLVGKAISNKDGKAQEQQQCADNNRRRQAPGLRDERTKAQCRCRSQTGHGHLHAHGRSQFLAFKPFGDDLRYRDACDVAAHAKEAEAQGGNEHLRLELLGNDAEEREGYIHHGSGIDMGDGPSIDACAEKH